MVIYTNKTSSKQGREVKFVICDSCLKTIDEEESKNPTDIKDIDGKIGSHAFLCDSCKSKYNGYFYFTIIKKLNWFSVAYKYIDKEYRVNIEELWN